MTRKRKSRRRWPVRFSARVHLDVVKAAGSLWEVVRDFWRSTGVSGPAQWCDVPVGALVVATSRGVDWLLLRSTIDSGALVGTLERGKACCQEDFEHEPWASLMRRNGAAFVRVLAKRVKPSTSAAKLESLAERAVAKLREAGE